jgi:exopolyphosphatase/guanosine-5'-triphosphate,3'-diphosphate pyrophosphatase
MNMKTRQASIDLGTNTCLLLVLEGDTILHDESNVVRLGQGVDQSKMLQTDAMARTLSCLEKYAAIVRSFGIQTADVLAVGTAQARDAGNATEFFQQIENQLGFRFRVLSGDEEANSTFIGAALPGMNPESMVVMDIGGGSTEIVQINGGKSLNMGAVRMTERYLKSDPVTDDEFWKCESAIDEALAELKPMIESTGKNFVAVAGTAVTLGMLQLSLKEFDRQQLDGFEITRGDAHRLVEELKWRSVAERNQMLGMEPKRADVILAGALIFWRAMEVLGFKSVKVSTRGLRYGVLKTLLNR